MLRMYISFSNPKVFYTVLGIGFGICFPLGSTIIFCLTNKANINLSNVLTFHSSNFLLMVIDTAPIVLGFYGYIIGTKQAKLEKAIQEVRTTNQIIKAFYPSQFLEILNKSNLLSIQPGDYVEQEVTILFTDIRDYTTLSEKMSPEENLQFISNYMQVAIPCIERYGGFVDKMIGDGIMAIFPHSPKYALLAAICMKKELDEFNQARLQAGKPIVKTGYGLHFGKVCIGTVGTSNRMQTTVIGDTVNVASRIEGWTKVFKTWILLSDSIALKLANETEFHIREIDIVKHKGKTTSMPIYECYNIDSPEIIQLKDSYKFDLIMAMAMYREGEFEEAIEAFRECSRICPSDPIPVIYINRCFQKQKEISSIDEKKKTTALIIDDDELLLSLLEKFLRKRDIEVHSLISGTQLTSVVDFFSPDFVIMDYHLPDGNGIEFSKKLKSLQSLNSSKAKIILTTAESYQKFISYQQEGIIDGFLQKPFQEIQLVSKLEELGLIKK